MSSNAKPLLSPIADGTREARRWMETGSWRVKLRSCMFYFTSRFVSVLIPHTERNRTWGRQGKTFATNSTNITMRRRESMTRNS